MAKNNSRKGYKNRKIQIFIVFLLAAFLIWLVSNMSETYTDETTFALKYQNVPDSLFLTRASQDAVQARLRTSGFQFLTMGFKNLEVNVDLSSLNMKDSKYFMTASEYRRQIERQLSDNIDLLAVDEDTLFFSFVHVYQKTVPIRSNLTIKPAQDYLLEGPLRIEPKEVTIKGPKNEIDTVSVVFTEANVLEGLTEDFESDLALFKPDRLQNTTYSIDQVQVAGSIFRFSESVLEVPVQVLNIPEGTEIKTFPNEVRVLCKASVDRLKELKASDLKIIADYGALRSDPQVLRVQLAEKPEAIYSVDILDEEVEFILRRL